MDKGTGHGQGECYPSKKQDRHFRDTSNMKYINDIDVLYELIRFKILYLISLTKINKLKWYLHCEDIDQLSLYKYPRTKCP